MGKFAAQTTVSTTDSKSEIERTVTRYGATSFASGWQGDMAVIGFTMEGRQVRFVLPLPRRDDPEFNLYKQGSTIFQRVDTEVTRRWEQACRQRWRALALVIKAKLEAVECNISTFEDEFLSSIVLPGGKTIGETVKPSIEQAYLTGRVQPLLPDYT